MNHQLALFTLPSYGLLKVSGTGAKKLLQGQLTCDMEKVQENMAVMAAHCSPQGRVISLFYLFLLQEDYYLFMPQSLIAITLLALKKYAVFYQVELSDASTVFYLTACGGTPLPGMHWITLPLQRPYQLVLNTSLPACSSTLLDENAWKQQMIRDRIPSIYPETSGVFLPHDINLHELEAISFSKGCYTGQEIIARMHYRGKIKNHLYRARMTGGQSLTKGCAIYYLHHQERRPAGSIVDYCYYEGDDQVLIMTDQLHAKDNHLFLHDQPNHFFEILDDRRENK